jgi:hypothetical protein
MGTGDKRDGIVLLDPQSMNSYGYARNNPLKLKDNNGEFWGEGAVNTLGSAMDSMLDFMSFGAGTAAKEMGQTGATTGGVINISGRVIAGTAMTALTALDVAAAAGGFALRVGWVDRLSAESGPASTINTTKALPAASKTSGGKLPGPTLDRNTGYEVGRFIVDERGNVMIEPVGGSTIFRQGGDVHTLYPNGSNYQRLNPNGHPLMGDFAPHGHAHLPGTGPGRNGQGFSLDSFGNIVPWNSSDAHQPIK